MNTAPKKIKKILATLLGIAGIFVVGIVFSSAPFSLSLGDAPHVSADTIGDYQPLTPLGGLGITTNDIKDLPRFLAAVFKLMLGAAAVLAVVMITYGGIEYLSTDTIFGQSEGKKRITNAVKGLVLAIAAWLILYTINPKTLEFSFDPPVPTTIQITPNNSNSQNNSGAYYKVSFCVLPADNEGDLEEEIRRRTDVVGTYTYDGVNILAAAAQQNCNTSSPTPGERTPEQAAANGCSTQTVVCTTSHP